jgi:hypothetical protein
MLPIALALAASMAAAPAPPPADIASIVSQRGCLAQMDPQFVLFVPPAPSSGPNPLFRLISGSPDERSADTTRQGARACLQPLMRTAIHH